MGMMHMRFAGPAVIEEWTMHDEAAVVAQAYAPGINRSHPGFAAKPARA